MGSKALGGGEGAAHSPRSFPFVGAEGGLCPPEGITVLPSLPFQKHKAKVAVPPKATGKEEKKARNIQKQQSGKRRVMFSEQVPAPPAPSPLGSPYWRVLTLLLQCLATLKLFLFKALKSTPALHDTQMNARHPPFPLPPNTLSHPSGRLVLLWERVMFSSSPCPPQVIQECYWKDENTQTSLPLRLWFPWLLMVSLRYSHKSEELVDRHHMPFLPPACPRPQNGSLQNGPFAHFSANS